VTLQRLRDAHNRLEHDGCGQVGPGPEAGIGRCKLRDGGLLRRPIAGYVEQEPGAPRRTRGMRGRGRHRCGQGRQRGQVNVEVAVFWHCRKWWCLKGRRELRMGMRARQFFALGQRICRAQDATWGRGGPGLARNGKSTARLNFMACTRSGHAWEGFFSGAETRTKMYGESRESSRAAI
jgi:hypothetical protein